MIGKALRTRSNTTTVEYRAMDNVKLLAFEALKEMKIREPQLEAAHNRRVGVVLCQTHNNRYHLMCLLLDPSRCPLPTREP